MYMLSVSFVQSTENCLQCTAVPACLKFEKIRAEFSSMSLRTLHYQYESDEYSVLHIRETSSTDTPNGISTFVVDGLIMKCTLGLCWSFVLLRTLFGFQTFNGRQALVTSFAHTRHAETFLVRPHLYVINASMLLMQVLQFCHRNTPLYFNHSACPSLLKLLHPAAMSLTIVCQLGSDL